MSNNSNNNNTNSSNAFHEELNKTTDELENIDTLKVLTEEHLQSDTLQNYLKKISKYHPLSMDEENKLGHLVRKGNKNAFKKLVLANLKFVVSIANKYRNTGVPLTDIINQGNLGLLEAAKRFDPDKDVKFITYAVWWIRQAIVQGLSEQTGTVKLPVKQARILHLINSAEEKLTKIFNRQPSVSELSEATGISEFNINDIIRVSRSDLSLDASLKDGDNFFVDFVKDATSNAEEEIIKRTLKSSIDEIVAGLDDREAKIISQRYGLGDEDYKTLEEIGKEMNISRERVRQIEARALDKLRKKALKRRLNDYLN